MGTAIVTLLLIFFISTSIFKKRAAAPTIAEINLCDIDGSELCVVTFGANNLDRMVIKLQLPDDDYPLFYVKASNRGVVNVYSCEVNEDDSTSVNCTGIRTPLGEAVELEVYTTDGDALLGQGEFMVSAILLSTPSNLTEIPERETEVPAEEVAPTEESTLDETTTPTP